MNKFDETYKLIMEEMLSKNGVIYAGNYLGKIIKPEEIAQDCLNEIALTVDEFKNSGYEFNFSIERIKNELFITLNLKIGDLLFNKFSRAVSTIFGKYKFSDSSKYDTINGDPFDRKNYDATTVSLKDYILGSIYFIMNRINAHAGVECGYKAIKKIHQSEFKVDDMKLNQIKDDKWIIELEPVLIDKNKNKVPNYANNGLFLTKVL